MLGAFDPKSNSTVTMTALATSIVTSSEDGVVGSAAGGEEGSAFEDEFVRFVLVASRAAAATPATTRTAMTGIHRFRLAAAGLLADGAPPLRFLLLLFGIANVLLKLRVCERRVSPFQLKLNGKNNNKGCCCEATKPDAIPVAIDSQRMQRSLASRRAFRSSTKLCDKANLGSPRRVIPFAA